MNIKNIIHNKYKLISRLCYPEPEFSGMMESVNRNKFWFKNGEFHRIDGPSIEYLNGDKHWFLNGKRHRLNGPAKEWSGGIIQWWINGNRYYNEKDFYNKIKEINY